LREIMIKKAGFIVFVLFLTSGLNGCIKPECTQDSDCVQAQCCHATSCVAKENAPDCTGIFCTQECQPDTLDCQQGACQCIDNKCEAVFY